MAAGTVNPKRVTSLTAIMLETISVVTKTATMIGYQRPGAGLLDSISSRNAGKSRPARPGAVFGLDRDPDTAANGEGAADATPAGIERRHQVVEDLVGDVLVEDAFVAIRPQIELERFRLENLRSGDVLYRNRGEVRLTCGRADAGELVALQADQVLSLRIVVGEGLEFLGRLTAAAQQSQAFEVRCIGHGVVGSWSALRRARTLSHVRQKAQASGALVGWPQRGQGGRPFGDWRISNGKAPLRFASRNER